MINNSKETEMRILKISEYNQTRCTFQKALDKASIICFQERIPNIIESIIYKNHELEKQFYESNQPYYNNSILGICIRNTFDKYLEEGGELLCAAVSEETKLRRLIFKKIGVSLNNKYYEKYKQMILKIKNFTISENIDDLINAKHNPNKHDEFISIIKEELNNLGYEELAQSINQDTNIITQKKKMYQK